MGGPVALNCSLGGPAASGLSSSPVPFCTLWVARLPLGSCSPFGLGCVARWPLGSAAAQHPFAFLAARSPLGTHGCVLSWEVDGGGGALRSRNHPGPGGTVGGDASHGHTPALASLLSDNRVFHSRIDCEAQGGREVCALQWGGHR